MHRKVVSLAFAVALGIVACQPKEKEEKAAPAAKPAAPSATTATQADDGGEVVATYGGKRLTTDRVLKEISRLPAPSRAYLTAPDRKRQFVDNMILNDLLFTEGQKLGYDKDDDVERQVNDLRRRLVVQRLVREFQKPPEITDEQAKAYYDDNPNLYSTTQIRASHILVKDEPTAKEILEQVKADPTKFADIAKEKSTDKTSGAKGGDLGMFGQGRMVPEFERAAFTLKQGEISDVVKTQYGYHIIMVVERKEGERRPFDQVKEQIKATLRNKAIQDQQDKRYAELKQNANVKVDDMVLDKLQVPQGMTGSETPMTGGH
ncbi:MAG TPA: peptidylprolyl isomerase [Candidatus Eisenbacteria bacterium]|nr:peptidylprolyl isomerase [Candidatus Eisenbacteria bacterium]